MSSIDERVVEMKFDNKQFEAGVKQTMDSLAALTKTLKMEGATKGLTDLNTAGKAVNLDHIGHQASAVAQHFQAMTVVAVTALATIAHQAVVTGGQLVKSLTVDPIKSGLAEYELNLNSIQTILANTGAANVTLEQVSEALQELNHYSDQTIYNFSEMARNIGTFTAAGVALEPAVEAIKGIANLAALSGSNSQQAATAMYQLSQAISAGRVALIDWTSVVNAGMGGTVFQRALAQTAVKMGELSASAVTLSGDMQTVTINGDAFRNSLQEGWLTADVLTKTLAQFTGDLTDAELAIMGYSATEIEAIQKQAAVAKAAATEVKTMSQMLGALREAAGSGWAKTWEIIFGDFKEAKVLWTGVYKILDDIIGGSNAARNVLLQDWKALTGRTELILAVKGAFDALVSVVKPIKEAFRSMFPPLTAKTLYELTVTLRSFTEGLIIGADTADKLKRTFAGVFAIIGIGWDILKEVVKLFFRLFGLATEGAGSFLEVTANIGDFLVALRKAIQEGEGFAKIFKLVGDVLSIPIKLIKLLAGYIGSLFNDFDAGGAANVVTGLVGKLEPLTRVGEGINAAFDALANTLDNVWNWFIKIASKAAGFFSEFGPGFREFFSGIDFQTLFAGINTGLFAGIVLMFRNLFGGNSVFSSIRESMEQLTDTMQTMQNTLRAVTLLQIAVAIGILTLSVNALSKIDAEGLTRALTAITVMFTQLFTSMLILEKMSGFDDIAQMYAIAGAMVILGVAIRILASSVKELAELDWVELSKGLVGVTALLGGVIAVGKFLPPSAGMISTATGITILAVAVKLLASSVTDLSGLSWEEMARGLGGVGAVLGGLILFTKFAQADKMGVLSGAGIVLLATGIRILADAIETMGDLSWTDMARGLTTMAIGLAALGVALTFIPPTAPLSAAGIFVAAASLGMMADAIETMGDMSWKDMVRGLTTLAVALGLITGALLLIPPTSAISAGAVLVIAVAIGILEEAIGKMSKMSWDEIVRGLTTLGVALGLIAATMAVMTGALPGAAALLVVAGALAILGPVISMLGQLEWEEVIRGLVTLAGAFTILGLAGLILTPIVPTLLGLGLAVTLIGAGMLLAGAGVLAFSIGLTALAVAGAAGAAGIVAFVAGLAGVIPVMLKAARDNVMLLAQLIEDSIPAMIKAMSAVIISVATAIDETSPKVMETLVKFMDLFLKTMVDNTPRFSEQAFKILMAILTAIKNNIAKVSQLALEIAAEWIKGISNGLPSIIQSAVDLILAFLAGITKAIDENSDKFGEAGGELALAIISGMVKGLKTGSSVVINAAKQVAKDALKAAMKAIGAASPAKEAIPIGKFFDQGIAVGIDKYARVVADSAEAVGNDAIYSLKKTISGINEVVRGEIDVAPVISPVIDLTEIRKTADEIGGLLRTQTISLETSFAKASEASAGYEENQDILAQNAATEKTPDIIYNQYNTSPKTLSEEEIYRQTRNQLSVVKRKVGS